MNSSLVVGTFASYLKCAKEASRALVKNWIIIPTAMALYLSVLILSGLIAPMGMAGGFVIGLISCISLSFYYSWIASSVRNEKVEWKELFEFDYPLFSSIINVGFIFWIGFFLIEHLIQGLKIDWLLTILHLGVFIIFNPVVEIIYLERVAGGTYALSEASEFAAANWIEWFVPIIILLAPFLILSPESALLVLAVSDVLLPMFDIVSSLISLTSSPLVVSALLISLLGTWLMIFRGYLYRELSSGTRRQRAFRWSQK